MIVRNLLSTKLLAILLATANATVQVQYANFSLDHIHTRRDVAYLNISSITAVPTTAFTSYQTGNLRRSSNIISPSSNSKRAASSTSAGSSQWNCTRVPIFTWGDTDNVGLGVQITNADTTWRGFYLYHNLCDYVPYKYIWINANSTEFVSLPAGFAGRIVRGTNEVGLVSSRNNIVPPTQKLPGRVDLILTDGFIYSGTWAASLDH